MSVIPVKCPKCGEIKLNIIPGDKYYCFNCYFQARLPTDHKMECESNQRMYRYYVRQLEDEVLRGRGIDPIAFRIGWNPFGLESETKMSPENETGKA